MPKLPGLRSKTLHFLSRNQRPPAKVPPRDFALQRPSGRHLYVCSHCPLTPLTLSLDTGTASQELIDLLRNTDLIDKTTKEIKQDDDKVVYKTLEEISDDLPDHSPRFVLLSYPLTLVSRPARRTYIQLVCAKNG